MGSGTQGRSVARSLILKSVPGRGDPEGTLGREACIALLRVATYQPPPFRAAMLDGDGHGEEEGDAAQGKGGGAPDEGDGVEEGNLDEEEGCEDATEHEEDEVEEHGEDADPEAGGEREAARDATDAGVREVGERDRRLE